MGERDAKARLQEMGATGDDFDLIEFYEPEGPPTKATLQEIGERCEVVVVDAAAGAYQMYGLDENRDAEKFNARMPDVLWRAGATCIVLDHVVKNREARGMWASGHHRKIGGTEVHIGFDAIPKLERGGVGRAIMTRHKDASGSTSPEKATSEPSNSRPDSPTTRSPGFSCPPTANQTSSAPPF